MNILSKFKTDWEEFITKDDDWNVELDINTISASEKLILITLNMSRYIGYNTTGYSIPTAERGITEQEAYDIWIADFQKNQRSMIKQLKAFGLTSIPQCVFDGLLLYYIINGDILQVTANEGLYEIRDHIVDGDWDSLASIIKRSNFNRKFCTRVSTIIRLSDYGKSKSRSWHRQTGIFQMRDKNEIGLLGGEDLDRARFAYYAETQRFLPNTPEGIKRTIAKQYNSTLVVDQFVYSDSNVFTINSSPSMDPVEKLKVEVNGEAIQHFFDFTLLNNVITITKSLNSGDIIRFTTKI
jgi:hypothetical protein